MMLYENVLKYVIIVEIVVIFVYYVFLVILIVFGNVLVIVVYLKNWWFYIMINIFIVGLVVVDLMVGFVLIFFWFYVYSCNYFDIIFKFVGYDFYIIFDIFIGCVLIF